jgi:hypothetical protein
MYERTCPGSRDRRFNPHSRRHPQTVGIQAYAVSLSLSDSDLSSLLSVAVAVAVAVDIGRDSCSWWMRSVVSKAGGFLECCRSVVQYT